MPPRPFPYALGIGTDIVHVPRIRAIILGKSLNSGSLERSLNRFLRRFLTFREQQAFWGRFTSQDVVLGSKLDEAARYLAGRWAAKEAAIKSMQSRRLNFMDIQILRTQSVDGRSGIFALILDSAGSPDPAQPSSVQTPESDASHETQHLSGQVAKISISHDGEYATAVCLAAEGPSEGDVGGEAAARTP